MRCVFRKAPGPESNLQPSYAGDVTKQNLCTNVSPQAIKSLSVLRVGGDKSATMPSRRDDAFKRHVLATKGVICLLLIAAVWKPLNITALTTTLPNLTYSLMLTLVHCTSHLTLFSTCLLAVLLHLFSHTLHRYILSTISTDKLPPRSTTAFSHTTVTFPSGSLLYSYFFLPNQEKKKLTVPQKKKKTRCQAINSIY